jgi:hypothetical protein
MTDPTAAPPDPVTPHIHDLSSATFRFNTKLWFEAPEYGASDPNDKGLMQRRQENDELYRSKGNATKWNRFTTLAYYALDDGMKFDKEWTNFESEPLTIHRIIWYNYMYHIDRDMDVVPKLNAWANQIAQPYLLEHDPAALDMDTMKYAYQDLPMQGEDMEIDDESSEGEWIPVPDKGKNRNQNKQINNSSTQKKSEETGISTAPGFNHPPEEGNTSLSEQHTANTTTNPPDDQIPTDQQLANTNGNKSPPKLNGQLLKDPQPRPASHVAPSTNDGTHRLTLKWNVPHDQKVEELESDSEKMEIAILNLIKPLFEESDGYFYRWESDDLTQRDTISNMTPNVFRTYVSPSITCIPSRQQIVLGIRYGFKTNPVAWKTRDKRDQMNKARVQVLISNSRCNSGNIVTAGYILLKAPNTTHRHRYTQHLREQLPEATPYFDVMRAIKSPMDQTIPHLAIQCGENHVTTVCQALSLILTGTKSAIFLPRYALQAMTDAQMQQHFEFHDKWAKSLAPVLMGPTIMHLDQPRLEYFADGTTKERSTREWAASLMLADGTTPALCDVVNGTSDRQAYLVAPRHYLEQAQTHWAAYRTRIAPPRHREARFQESVHNLPDYSLINTEVLANVTFLERMSAAEIWKQAPETVRDATTKASKAQRLPPPPKIAPVTQHDTQQASGTTSPKQGANATTTDGAPGTHQQDESHASATSSIASDEDNESTDSTAELTRASANTYQARFHQHSQMFKSQQKAIESLGKTSSDRLSLIERQLHRFEAFDTKLAAVGSQLENMSTNQQHLTASMKAIKDDNKIQKANANKFQEQSNKKIDALSQTVADAMTAILGMGAQFNIMSEQVLKISVQLDSNEEKPAKCNASDEESGAQEPNNMYGTCEMEHEDTGDRNEHDRPSDASLSSASTKHSGASVNSGTSTYTHTSPVKKKRTRSQTRQRQSHRMATISSSTNTERHNNSDTVGRNLAASFQQHADSQDHTQAWQDKFDESGGNEEEETESFSAILDDDDETNESETDDTYCEWNHNDEEEEFMTPPSSPSDCPNENTSPAARSTHDINKNVAPLNPQYNETTGSAGAPKT